MSIYELKIKLSYLRPEIWRKIQISKDITFWELHLALVCAMGWQNNPKHKFDYTSYSPMQDFIIGNPEDCVPKKSIWSAILKEREPVVCDERTTKICDHLTEYKQSIDYEYGIGLDRWYHSITLEKILTPKLRSRKQYPVCTGGRRSCPPENCGSYRWFSDHLKPLKDSHHPKHQETMELLAAGGYEDYDFDRFDPKAVDFSRFHLLRES